ncbi:MAG: phosphate starvation-inducible protein PsiF, partial [Burkholderiales bacterium]|nr:phosphate starvation-inducible protein PsiF [Burkholderiales bacterium]
MKSLVALALAGAVAFTPAAFAADPPKAATATTAAPAAAPAKSAAAAPAPAKAAEAKAPNAQQERMKSCNEKATGKSGDDRKKFMSACLSGDAPPK